MLIFIAAMWAISMPAGYLTGMVYEDAEALDNYALLPLVAALLPPLAAILAVALILRKEIK